MLQINSIIIHFIISIEKIYDNLNIDKSLVLSDNKDRTGVYMWIHKSSGKIYVGSAFNLSRRFTEYYSSYYLKRNKSMYICNALGAYGHSEFSLIIIEYINTLDIDKKEVRKLLLLREQNFLDSIQPEFNILKTAGSLLGHKHSPETIAKISGENSHMYGKIGPLNPFFGKFHSDEIKALIGQARKGKILSAEIKTKISITKGTTIFVHDLEDSLVDTFHSARRAAEYFNCGKDTIHRYVKSKKIFKNNYILSVNSDK